MDFLKLFREFVNYHENTNILFDKRKPKTITAYNVRYRSINNFLYRKGLVKLKSQDFTLNLAKEYFNELSGNHSHNYAVRHVEVCRSVLDFAAQRDIIKYNPLSSFQVKKIAPGKPTHLLMEELRLLEKYIPDNSMKEKAQRMFLFQCYTGMDYGDLMSVTADNIVIHRGREYLVKKRLKTGIDAFIPLVPEAKKLLYEKVGVLSNCKYNLALKDVFKDLEINKVITSHVGRKTYAMTKLNIEGYSIEAVSKMAGHKSVKTTETYYAQVNIDLISRELDRLGV